MNISPNKNQLKSHVISTSPRALSREMGKEKPFRTWVQTKHAAHASRRCIGVNACSKRFLLAQSLIPLPLVRNDMAFYLSSNNNSEIGIPNSELNKILLRRDTRPPRQMDEQRVCQIHALPHAPG